MTHIIVHAAQKVCMHLFILVRIQTNRHSWWKFNERPAAGLMGLLCIGRALSQAVITHTHTHPLIIHTESMDSIIALVGAVCRCINTQLTLQLAQTQTGLGYLQQLHCLRWHEMALKAVSSFGSCALDYAANHQLSKRTPLFTLI
jgi:hypothetical protein